MRLGPTLPAFVSPNVLNYLVKMGLDPARLTAVGYGMTRPVASNDTPEGKQKNRRVDLVIADPALGN